MHEFSAHTPTSSFEPRSRFARKRDAAKLFLNILEEAIWPTRCAICDASDYVLCPDCKSKLPYIDACRACKRCGAPYGSVQCSECNLVMLEGLGLTQLPYTAAASAVMLNEGTRSIVSVYKDSGERRLARVMAEIMCPYVDPTWLHETLTLSYLPASQTALNRRGFDHAELIAQELARILSIPCLNLFDRPKTLDQRSLSRADRASNMREAVSVRPGAEIAERILLVDDVYTTGSSLCAASKALTSAGAEEVFCLTFARA